MKRASWLTMILLPLLLTGCGQVLDWSNAQVSNGHVYEQGKNEPFTGTLTNVPAKEIQVHLQRIEEIVGALQSVLNGDGSAVSSSMTAYDLFIGSKACNVEIDEGLISDHLECFYAGSNARFMEADIGEQGVEGEIDLYAKNGNRFARIPVREGKLDGPARWWFADKPDQLMLETAFAPDLKEGTFTHYWGDGQVRRKGRYEGGRLVEESNFEKDGTEFLSRRQMDSWFDKLYAIDSVVLSDKEESLLADAERRYSRTRPESPSAREARAKAEEAAEAEEQARWERENEASRVPMPVDINHTNEQVGPAAQDAAN